MPLRTAIGRRIPFRRTTRRFLRTKRSKYTSIARVAGKIGANAFSFPGGNSMAVQLTNRKAPFGLTHWCDLVYCDQGILYGAAATPLVGTTNTFWLTSLYKPDGTGGFTNHQPYMFDQLNTIYKSYQVFRVSISVTFFNPVNTYQFGVCQITDSGDTGAALATLSMTKIMERQGCWAAPVPAYGGRAVTFTRSINLWELEGLTYQQYAANQDCQAFVNASPVNLPQLQVGAGDLNAPVTPTPVYCLVKIVYHAKFFGLVSQNQS